jgi:hypothetical protein
MKKRPRLLLARATVRALSHTDLASIAGASGDCETKPPKCVQDPDASARGGKEHVECFTDYAEA